MKALSDHGCIVIGDMRFWAHFNLSGYPYFSLYCCVQPWHGATFGMQVAWFGFIAGWEPYGRDASER